VKKIVKLHEAQVVKGCKICTGRFVESKGFHKKGDGKYRNVCKKCRNEHESSKITHQLHSWKHEGDKDECKRCGIQSKKIPNIITGRLSRIYFVGGVPTSVRPACLK
jgi:hypothetical protein